MDSESVDSKYFIRFHNCFISRAMILLTIRPLHTDFSMGELMVSYCYAMAPILKLPTPRLQNPRVFENLGMQ